LTVTLNAASCGAIRKTLANDVTCTEYGRRPLPGERWSLRFTDLGEVAVYCPGCDGREYSGRGLTYLVDSGVRQALDPSRQLFEQTIFPAKGSVFGVDSE